MIDTGASRVLEEPENTEELDLRSRETIIISDDEDQRIEPRGIRASYPTKNVMFGASDEYKGFVGLSGERRGLQKETGAWFGNYGENVKLTIRDHRENVEIYEGRLGNPGEYSETNEGSIRNHGEYSGTNGEPNRIYKESIEHFGKCVERIGGNEARFETRNPMVGASYQFYPGCQNLDRRFDRHTVPATGQHPYGIQGPGTSTGGTAEKFACSSYPSATETIRLVWGNELPAPNPVIVKFTGVATKAPGPNPPPGRDPGTTNPPGHICRLNVMKDKGKRVLKLKRPAKLVSRSHDKDGPLEDGAVADLSKQTETWSLKADLKQAKPARPSTEVRTKHTGPKPRSDYPFLNSSRSYGYLATLGDTGKAGRPQGGEMFNIELEPECFETKDEFIFSDVKPNDGKKPQLPGSPSSREDEASKNSHIRQKSGLSRSPEPEPDSVPALPSGLGRVSSLLELPVCATVVQPTERSWTEISNPAGSQTQGPPVISPRFGEGGRALGAEYPSPSNPSRLVTVL